MPVLESFLPDDCAFRRRVCLVPNECMDTVHLGEPFNEVVPVLPDSLHKIRGHAYVQGAVALACEDVYAGDPLCLVAWVWHVFGSRLRSLGSGLRRNDGGYAGTTVGSLGPRVGYVYGAGELDSGEAADVVDEPFEHSEASGAAYDVGVHREHEGASVVVGSLESGGPDVVDVSRTRHDGDLDPSDGA